MNSRIVSVVLIVLSLISLPSHGLVAGMKLVQTEDLGGGLYAYRFGPYRNIFIVTDEGVIATDPLSVRAAKLMRQEIAKITDKPVKFVAYSHSHWDHATGGQIFKDEGAQFVAQRECTKNMAETKHPDVVLPDISFDDYYKISLGDAALEMFYFGPSHDDCMVVMVARPANIMFIIDISSAPTGWEMEYNPTMAEGYLYNMVPYLKSVEEMAEREGIDTIVSGHLALGYRPNGKMFQQPSTGPVAAIREKREFFEILFEAVRDELAKGTKVEDMPDILLASPSFQENFLNKMHRKNWKESEMRILLRRIATYIITGR